MEILTRMEVNRKIINKFKMHEDNEDGYVKADMPDLISMIWEITQDAWSFVKGQDAEQRLQRNVAVLTGRKC
jgi:hypothetical protein